MTIEEMYELFGEFRDEYLRYERIDDPLHARPDLCAFLMLHDTVPGTRNMVCGATHDEIWLEVSSEKLAEVATREMVRDLIRCGVRLDRETGSLAMFA